MDAKRRITCSATRSTPADVAACEQILVQLLHAGVIFEVTERRHFAEKLQRNTNTRIVRWVDRNEAAAQAGILGAAGRDGKLEVARTIAASIIWAKRRFKHTRQITATAASITRMANAATAQKWVVELQRRARRRAHSGAAPSGSVCT